MAQTWKQFFDGHAPRYMENEFTHNTLVEVDFLLQELQLSPGARILDIGCGTGRHSIELARRGYQVTGLDLSVGMLEEAQRAADRCGVEVTWIQRDATALASESDWVGRFDGVIGLCEGGIGLLGAEDDAIEQPLAILRGVERVLGSGAPCLFTVLNGYALARKSGSSGSDRPDFDPLTLAEVSEWDPGDSGGIALRERGFVPTELTLLFRLAGLRVTQIWGGTAGNWRRGPIDLDEIEIMVIGEKP